MKRPQHPYADLEDSPLWPVIRKAVRDLAKNGDLDLRTAEPYVVGYVAQALDRAGFRQVSEVRRGARVLRVVEVRDEPDRAEVA